MSNVEKEKLLQTLSEIKGQIELLEDDIINIKSYMNEGFIVDHRPYEEDLIISVNANDKSILDELTYIVIPNIENN